MTWAEVLSGHALSQADRPVFSFYSDDAGEPATLTYRELDRRARAIGAELTRRNLSGRPALLTLPAGLDYVAGFFGCLYAGTIAVPAYPASSKPQSVERLIGMWRDSGAETIITTGAVAARMGKWLADVPDAPPTLVTLDSIDADAGDGWSPARPDPDDLAFLQYTSGSTSSPRGVALSHANLLANTALMARLFGVDQDSRAVSWLPMFHDMGLIGFVLGTVRCGSSCALMAPATFVRNPARWLEVISTTRAHLSGGPNFAYDLCSLAIGDAQLATLDLSSWRIAFNGAEPIREATLRRFADRFAPAGFQAAAMLPCYGLAESSLLVTAAPAGGGFRTRVAPREAGGGGAAAEVVSVGTIPGDVRVEIVDPERHEPVVAGEIGEIWTASASVAAGYWGRPEESGAVFGARLAGTAEPAYLRTGDLGFIADGQLHVTGRRKDLLIIRGRNHYPQDIEATVESCDPALVPHSGAAFTVLDDGGEQLVVVHEVHRGQPADGLAARVAARIAEVHEVRPDTVVLIAASSLHRTTSGKVARFACRAAYLDGTLAEVARHRDRPAAEAPAGQEPPPDLPLTVAATAEHLRTVVAATLGAEPRAVPLDRPLAELGLDSLDAVRLRHHIETAFRVTLPDEDDAVTATVTRLAELIVAGTPALPGPAAPHPASPRPAAAVARPAGPVDLEPSPNQAGLWFLHQLAPASTAYHLWIVAEATGPVRLDALRAALESVVARHPALRTTFPARAGQPVQRVHPGLSPEVGEVDAAGWSEAEVDDACAETAARPFDLDDGPLLRVAVLRRGPEVARLVLVVHHLVCDLWSVEVLLDELGRFYAGRLDLAPGPRRPAPADYLAACARQAARLAGPDGERLWDYWRERLADAPTTLELPTDRARPAAPRFRGDARTFRLSADTTARLVRLARANGTTLYTVLLCAYQVLLFRYTGQRDLLVGSPVHGRAGADEAEAVGPFMNTVVIRGVIDPDETFADLLRRATPEVRRSLAHGWMPLALLVAKTRAPREANRSPLIQTLFTFQRAARAQSGAQSGALAGFVVGAPSAELTIGPLRLRPVTGPAPGAQFDLQLTFAESGAELAGLLQFDTDLFDGSTADRIAGHLVRLLDAIGTGAATPVARLDLLTDAERQRAMRYAQGPVLEPGALALPQLITAQAARTPHAPAVVYDDKFEPAAADLTATYPTLTYRELDQAANRLAHRLIRQGVGAEQIVGIHLDRHTDLLVAMLAVMRAGAAYLPIDPGLPAARIDFMLRDSAVRTVLTSSARLDALPADRAFAICLDTLGPALEAESPQPPAVRPHPDNVCYVLYTSGSTGRPKGVAVSYGALANFLSAMMAILRPAPGDRLLAVTTISFDISGLELYLPLISGGTVHLLARQAAADGLQLRRRLDTGAFAMMQATPATWQLLCDAGWTPGAGLTMLCGGEALPVALAGRLSAGEAGLWNLYGPTETTIWSTAARLAQAPQGAVPIGAVPTGAVAIGTPIASTDVYIVDAAMQLVPAGVPGEIMIGGAGLARGYLKRPALTATAWVPDPFSGRPGARLYRTGDIARISAAGEIELLGRRDHQVKINGHRIELGEVETALERHPLVRRAVATTVRRPGGGATLVAHVQPAPVGHEAAFDRPRATATLLGALREQLPGYLVPAQLAWVSDFPLSPAGKIDRSALRPPAAAPDRVHVPPATPTAVMLTGILDELLQAGQIGAADNLFDLGAHSLLITRFLGRVRESCGVELTLAEVFSHPTVADLAELVSARATASPGARDGSRAIRTADRSVYLTATTASAVPRTVAAIRRLKEPSGS
jgi:amino acid adenylation domain-containing protein